MHRRGDMQDLNEVHDMHDRNGEIGLTGWHQVHERLGVGKHGVGDRYGRHGERE